MYPVSNEQTGNRTKQSQDRGPVEGRRGCDLTTELREASLRRDYLSQDSGEDLSLCFLEKKAPTQMEEHEEPQEGKCLVCVKKEIRNGGWQEGTDGTDRAGKGDSGTGLLQDAVRDV